MDRFNPITVKTKTLPHRWVAIGVVLCLLSILAATTHSGLARESAPTRRTFSIPSIQSHVVDDPNAFVYTVRLGEYWILISRKFGVSYDELRNANLALWTQRGELIWPGDEMSIPGLTVADQWETVEYMVQPGDSWYAIADQFGVNYWDLRLDNLGLWRLRRTIIRPGDLMQIVNPNPSAPVAVEQPDDASATASQPMTSESTATQPTAAPPPTAQPAATSQPSTQPEATATTAPGTLPTSTASGPPFRVTDPPAGAVIYSVRPGDSWFSIAARYGITFENLRSANQSLWALRGQDIRTADEMIIPAHGSPPPPLEIRTVEESAGTSDATVTNYTVQEGDTWASVAASTGVTEEALKGANLKLSRQELVPGAVIRIP